MLCCVITVFEKLFRGEESFSGHVLAAEHMMPPLQAAQGTVTANGNPRKLPFPSCSFPRNAYDLAYGGRMSFYISKIDPTEKA